MRCYVVTTGTIFVALLVAHLARFYVEGAGILGSPAFVLTSVGSAAMAIWSWRVYRRLPPRNSDGHGAA
jgi:hypothetical protein